MYARGEAVVGVIGRMGCGKMLKKLFWYWYLYDNGWFVMQYLQERESRRGMHAVRGLGGYHVSDMQREMGEWKRGLVIEQAWDSELAAIDSGACAQWREVQVESMCSDGRGSQWQPSRPAGTMGRLSG